jgi:HSP20 family protein
MIKYNRPVDSFPRLFDSFWLKDMDNLPLRSQFPANNIFETDEEFGIELVAPGLSKEAFNLVIENDKLTVSYKQEDGNEASLEKRYLTQEFAVTEFTKTYNLPKGKVNEEKVSAAYNNGILTVTLPKREEAKPKQPVSIKVG